MNLTIDIGNSSVKAGLFEGERLAEAMELPAEELPAVCRHDGVERLIVSCVAQGISLQSLLPAHLQHHVHYLSAASHLPFRIDYATPQTLGTDRIAAAAGAMKLFPSSPLIVIDAGTCITIDFIDAQRVYRGGAILPGIHLKLAALHEHTARLPQISFDSRTASALPPLTGKSTEDSILAGVATATAMEVEGFVSRYTAACPGLRTVLTGGDAPYLHRVASYPHATEEHLLLQGLNAILSMN